MNNAMTPPTNLPALAAAMMDADGDVDASSPAEGMVAAPTSTIQRGTPEPPERRAALVTEWCDLVATAREYWTKAAFKRIKDDMAFVAGKQWVTEGKPGEDNFLDEKQHRYVANITLRHIAARTASIYGKNPKIIARKKPRLLSTVWDGNMQTLQAAMQAVAMNPLDPTPNMIVQDALNTMTQQQMLTNTAKTLELLFEHELDEQPVPFKVQMKSTVRRGLTTGVGWVKLGYQRVMNLPPEIDAQISTYEQQLATVERLSADMADHEIQENEAKAEQLRLAMADLAATEQIVVREGLTFTYPHSTAIIPDTNTQQLRGFVGGEWVAEEYFLTADRIKEIYKVDVSAAASGNSTGEGNPKLYARHSDGTFVPSETTARNGKVSRHDTFHCVWEIYNRTDGLVYVVCEGYPDFLVEPSAPDVKLERFFPWFGFVVNEVYAEDMVFPPSDVRLMRDMQMELNRSRQGLREHRRASMPKTVARKGVLSDDDKDAIQDPIPLQVIELDSLQPGEKVQDMLQTLSGPDLDPRLYDPSPAYEDYLRTLGQQEANLGGTSGATATEASIAEGSRVSSVGAVVDDLDEFLGELARAAGQVLLAECSKQKVMEVVGPGAVWPELKRDQIAKEIYLDVEAASTGRPNKAQEVQVAQAIFPMLMQIPGISAEFMGRELLRRMDDRLDITDAFAPGVPSIMMMNRAPMGGAPGAGPGAAPTAAQPEDDPNAQGPQGAANAPSTQPPQVNAAPRPPGAGGVGRPPMVPPPQPGP